MESAALSEPGAESSTALGQTKTVKKINLKREDTQLHLAARSGDRKSVVEILCNSSGEELKKLIPKRNQSGETALYVAAEYGFVDLVKEMIKYYDLADAGIKANNGFDALHIAAKQGDLEILKVLLEAHPELAMTVDLSNTTALHTAATQGHIHIVHLLLQSGVGLATIAKSNGKTALHSAARNGHVEVVRSLMEADPKIAERTDNKGQTALHMAVKGHSHEVVGELIRVDPSLMGTLDNKGNSALHIATRKGRAQIVKLLLEKDETDTRIVNRTGETALDTAEKTGQSDIKHILQHHGVQSATTIQPKPQNPANELKQTVSDIKHEVHDQLEHTRQTRKRVQGIAKRINKMHVEGLNNAINSTTVVAVLIATVAFAGIFTVPGEYVDEPNDIPPGHSLGEANIASRSPFIVFFIFDSVALFISLAVVVVQTSVVVIESKAKKQMMAVINKLMWLACVLVSVAFLALSFVVVGAKGRWLAIGVTVIGATIMVPTLGTMSYWVIRHRIEAKSMKKGLRRSSSLECRSRSSWSRSFSDSGLLFNENKKMYAI